MERLLKQLRHQVVCEKRQLNDVFVHLVENRNVLAQQWNRTILLHLIQILRELDKCEKIVQNVNHGIPIVVDFIQDANSPTQVSFFQLT